MLTTEQIKTIKQGMASGELMQSIIGIRFAEYADHHPNAGKWVITADVMDKQHNLLERLMLDHQLFNSEDDARDFADKNKDRILGTLEREIGAIHAQAFDTMEEVDAMIKSIDEMEGTDMPPLPDNPNKKSTEELMGLGSLMAAVGALEHGDHFHGVIAFLDEDGCVGKRIVLPKRYATKEAAAEATKKQAPGIFAEMFGEALVHTEEMNPEVMEAFKVMQSGNVGSA